jgi:hypothetical protein
MGYNIEISFNLIKNSNVTKILEMVKQYANKYNCQNIYNDYEFEINQQFKRSHCVITINFQKTDILNLIEFLKFIKTQKYLFIETIYNEISSKIIYTSQYYRTQKMNKTIGKNLKNETKDNNFSIDEMKILNTIRNS